MKSDCYALFDLAQWKNGLAFKKIDFSSDGEPVIKIAELKNGITGQTQFTEGDYGDEVHLTKGDMLFSWSGNPETSIDVFWYNLPDGWLNQHIFKVIPKPFVDRYFLYYLLKSLKETFTAIASNKQTTGLGHITLKDLKKLNIALPSEKEQKIIGRYLYTIDQKISVNQAINDNLQQQAFALFEQLLLTADDGECSVADIAHLNPKRALAKNQEAKCIEMSQLSTSGAFPSGWEKRPFNGGMRFSNGDTLLARITPCLENGKAAFIDFLDTSEVAFGSTEYIVLAPKGEIPPEFLYCLARYPVFSDYAVKNMNGSSGRQRVSAETIGQFKLPRPSTNELKRFGNVVSSLFLKMRFNSLENMRLSSLRDSLLPKLMSGELDVSELDI